MLCNIFTQLVCQCLIIPHNLIGYHAHNILYTPLHCSIMVLNEPAILPNLNADTISKYGIESHFRSRPGMMLPLIHSKTRKKRSTRVLMRSKLMEWSPQEIVNETKMKSIKLWECTKTLWGRTVYVKRQSCLSTSTFYGLNSSLIQLYWRHMDTRGHKMC